MAVMLLFSALSFAQVGNLDSSFGTNGIHNGINILELCMGNKLTQLSDGKIVVVSGASSNNPYPLNNGAIVTVDNTGNLLFNAIFTLAVESSFTDLAKDANDKIITVGPSSNGFSSSEEVLIARYNSNCLLDTSFNGTGYIYSYNTTQDESFHSVAIQNDGKILVGGYIDTNFVVCRYNSNGQIDNSFGNSGIATLFSNNYFDKKINDIHIASDGNIFVAGGYLVFGGAGGFVAKINSSGVLDNNFNTDGIYHYNMPNSVTLNFVKLLGSGKILCAGMDNGNALVIELESNGTLSSTFGTGGILTNNFNSSESWYDAVQLSNGKIILGGKIGDDGALAAINSDGTIDNPFGVNGVRSYNLSNQPAPEEGDVILGLYLDVDGNILTTGYQNFFSQSGDSYGRYFISKHLFSGASAIVSMEKNIGFTVYPNPVAGDINIRFEKSVSAEIRVSDNLGRLIQIVELNGDNFSIDLSDFLSGIYILQIICDQKIETINFVKK